MIKLEFDPERGRMVVMEPPGLKEHRAQETANKRFFQEHVAGDPQYAGKMVIVSEDKVWTMRLGGFSRGDEFCDRWFEFRKHLLAEGVDLSAAFIAHIPSIAA